MATQVARIPETLLGRVRVVSAVMGVTPGEVLDRAFSEYVDNHRDELTHTFELSQKYVLSGDVDTIMEVTKPSRERRAKAAADRLASLRPQ